MRKHTKVILIALTGISLFTILLVVNFSFYEKPQLLSKVENISLIVDYNNGTIKERYNFTLDGGKTTPFDALKKWCDIEYEDFGWGIIVRVIDGIGGSWIYMVNNYSPSVGAPVYSLKDGDVVKWKKVA